MRKKRETKISAVAPPVERQQLESFAGLGVLFLPNFASREAYLQSILEELGAEFTLGDLEEDDADG